MPDCSTWPQALILRRRGYFEAILKAGAQGRRRRTAEAELADYHAELQRRGDAWIDAIIENGPGTEMLEHLDPEGDGVPVKQRARCVTCGLKYKNQGEHCRACARKLGENRTTTELEAERLEAHASREQRMLAGCQRRIPKPDGPKREYTIWQWKKNDAGAWVAGSVTYEVIWDGT